ncbi:MAG: diacylglycerol/lipid kinase family protein [Gemmatimonadales bacterium]
MAGSAVTAAGYGGSDTCWTSNREPGSWGARPRLTTTLVIVNPIAGGGRAALVWRRIEGILRADPGIAEARFTTAPGDAEEWATAWGACHPGGVVAVVGGDGSVHEAVNGMGASGRLAIIPAGSGNDMARNLGVSPDPVRAARLLLDPDGVKRVDIARCTLRSPAGEHRVRYFVNSLSVGVSARANRIAAGLGRMIKSAGRYPLAGALALLTRGASRYEVRANGRTLHTGLALNITVANGACFGGGLRVAPEANVTDGVLDLVVIGAMSRLRALRALTRLRAGTHTLLPGVGTSRVSERIGIVGPPGPLGIELDGENLEAEGGLQIDVLPGALAVVGAGSHGYQP